VSECVQQVITGLLHDDHNDLNNAIILYIIMIYDILYK
jgi:hypothetical protein